MSLARDQLERDLIEVSDGDMVAIQDALGVFDGYLCVLIAHSDERDALAERLAAAEKVAEAARRYHIGRTHGGRGGVDDCDMCESLATYITLALARPEVPK